MSTPASARGRIGPRIGRVLEWTPAEKCVLVASVVLAFVLWYTAGEWYVLRHPDAAPYFDRTYLGHSYRIHLVELVVWAVLAAVTLWARTHA